MRAFFYIFALSLLLACEAPGGQPGLELEFQAASYPILSQRRPLDSLRTVGPAHLSMWDSLLVTYQRRLQTASSLPAESRRAIESGLAEIAAEALKYRRDPAAYNLGGALKQVLAENKIPLTRRLLAIEAQMKQAPAYYQAAKANLYAPLPARCRLAVEKHSLALEFLSNELSDSLSRSSLSEAEAYRFKKAAEQARMAVKDYLAFCQSLYFEHQDSLILRNH